MTTRSNSRSRVILSEREVQVVSRVLSDPRRFEILRHIANQNCSACSDLRQAFPITAATLSHHMRELEAAGLIELTRRGKFIDATFQRATWRAYLNELKSL